jgi:hypothetical protein
MKWKNNFFNFAEQNQWDIGYPMSPRLFCLIIFIVFVITMNVLYILETYN